MRLGVSTLRVAQPSTSGRLLLVTAPPSARLLPRQPLWCASIGYDERTTSSAPSPPPPPQTAPVPSPTSSNGNGISNNTVLEVKSQDGSGPSEKELARRKKISAANKGRSPWNKGRPCSESMRAKIRQRTFEAMQRPHLYEANQHRKPHREDVKKRISQVLRERVRKAKSVIAEHATRIVEGMKESDDAVERSFAEQESTHDTVCRVTYRFVNRDYENTFDRWETNDNGFRTLLIARLVELSERAAQKQAVGRRRASRTSVGKVRRAMATQSKLIAAKEKLTKAEATLVNVLPMKAKLANNPKALEKISRIEAAVPKLRDQVDALTEAMAPLQHYLTPLPTTSATEFVLHQQAAAEEAAATTRDDDN